MSILQAFWRHVRAPWPHPEASSYHVELDLNLPAPQKTLKFMFFQYFHKFPHFCIFCGLKGILTRLEDILEPSLTVLGASWRRLGPYWAPSWSVLGRILASQNPPKIAPRGLQDAFQDDVQHKPQLKTLKLSSRAHGVPPLLR